MNAPQVRLATAADASALLAIENHAFPSDRISARQMHYLLTRAKAATWVAADGDQILGYVMLLLPDLPRPCRIYSLAVDARHRGRKIAGLLIRQALAFSRSQAYRRIRLEVRATDTRVQSIYSGYNFAVVARLPDYYDDGEDALRMELCLPSKAAVKKPDPAV